jgi:hypothetical protein
MPADQVRPLPSSVVLLPRPPQYYGPLRLPLRAHPLRRLAAYRARCSQATRELAPHGSHCWGGDGSLLFPRWLCQRSTPSTPLVLRGCISKHFTPSLAFVRGDGTRLQFAPCGGILSTRQASLHAADRWLAPSPGGLDPALRRSGLPERRRAATKVTWFLLRPDFHRLVIVSFQDATSPGLLALDLACGRPQHTLPTASFATSRSRTTAFVAGSKEATTRSPH